MTDRDHWEEIDEILAGVGHVYDLDGNPWTFREWHEARERGETRIARTEIDDVSVSTVHLGLDHSYGTGPPLIFETLVFGGTLDGEMWRYPTREDAEEGHEHAVELVRLEIAVQS